MHATHLITVIAGAAALVAAGPTHAQHYTVTAVGPALSDSEWSIATDVNDAGAVFGTAYVQGGRRSHCFVHTGDQVIVFTAEDGLPFIWSGAINNTETLVGMSMIQAIIGSTRGSYVTGPQFLPELFPVFPEVFPNGAADVNNSGPPWVAGQRDTGNTIGSGQFPVRQAYLVLLDGNPNPPVQLGTLGGFYSRAEALNDARDVVGGASIAAGPTHAFIRRSSTGQMQSLGTLGGNTSCALDINNAGQVVGWSRHGDGSTHAFIHHNKTMTSLGTLGGHHSEALGINEIGHVVGMSLNTNARPRAFLHDGDTMIDLNTRIPANAGWTLQYARAINENGEIVGWGRLAGATRAFKLSPAPHLLGDINSDGILDEHDRAAFCDAIGSSLGDPRFNMLADFTGDDAVDHLDLAIFNNIVTVCDGDVVTSSTFAPPPDGVTDAADLAYLLGAWASESSCADFVTSESFAPPPDGVVDAADLAFLLAAWGPCE